MEPVRITMQDIAEGRAYIRLSPEAKVKLLHMAGAPWSQQNPDAKLSDLQKEVLGRKERIKIVLGGSRLGKSVLGGCELLCELAVPGTKSTVIAATYDLCGSEFQYAYDGFIKLFGRAAATRLRCVNLPAQKEFIISTIWGAEARAYSTDTEDGQAILGKEFDLVVLGEGSQISAEIWQNKIRRAIDGRIRKVSKGSQRMTGRAVIYTTPDGFDGASAHEVERVRKLTNDQPDKLHFGEVPYPQTVYFRTASVLENPDYDPEVFEAAKKTLDKAAFETQYLGKMVRRTGLVVPEFSKEHHIRPMPPRERIKDMRLAVGIDTGHSFGAVLAGIEKNRTKWILADMYTEGMRTSENAEEIRRMVVEALGPVFGFDASDDSAFDKLRDRIDLWMIDPASQGKYDLDEHLEVGLGAEKHDWQTTMNAFRDMFKSNRLFLTEEVSFLPEELSKLTWPVMKDYRQTGQHLKTRGKDHVTDAARFALIPLEAAGPLEDDAQPMDVVDAFKQQQRRAVIGGLQDSLSGRSSGSLAEDYARDFGGGY